MKLRLKGNSLRLRVTRSELARLQQGGVIEDSVQFAPAAEASLRYLLQACAQPQPVQVPFDGRRLLVTISRGQLTAWSGETQVGIYAALPLTGDTVLDVAIEKDFACLDLSDEENHDTFPHPLAGKAC